MNALRRVWPFVRPHRGVLALGAGLAVVEVLVGLAQPWPLKYVVDALTSADGGVGGVVGGSEADIRRVVSLACAALVLIVVLAALMDYWSTRLLSSAGLRLGASLREAVFAHLNRLSLRYHGESRVGDLSSRVTSDADRVQDMVVQFLAVLLPNGLLMLGMLTVMVVLDPQFALLAVAATPLLVIAVVRSTRALRLASRRARTADGEVAAVATESLGAIQLVQALSMEGRQKAQFAELARRSLVAGLDAARLQARFSPVVDLTAVASTVVVLWAGALRVMDGRLTLGELLVFLSYVGSLYKPIKALAKLGTVLSKGLTSVERLEAVLSTEPQVADRPGSVPIIAARGEVELDRVCFSYGREQVLRDVSLCVQAGETLALVGPTGAGKSTVALLVCRLADPASGRVLLDGRDVRGLTVRSVRKQVSMVLQECTLLQGSLRENIAVGRPGATEQEIERAARLALVDEFSWRLPDGLDTRVGERGAQLSGGQRQRVAIARAIIRDAPVLVLDEPTSALDAASEELLVEALANLPGGRTTLVIAHRLSTIRRADRIAVLDGGRVVEQGSHTGLLRDGGLYHRLHAFQAGAGDSAHAAGTVHAVHAVHAASTAHTDPAPVVIPWKGRPA